MYIYTIEMLTFFPLTASSSALHPLLVGIPKSAPNRTSALTTCVCVAFITLRRKHVLISYLSHSNDTHISYFNHSNDTHISYLSHLNDTRKGHLKAGRNPNVAYLCLVRGLSHALACPDLDMSSTFIYQHSRARGEITQIHT
jgi:hypothetical protein